MGQEDTWNTQATILKAEDRLGTHLLHSLDTDNAKISGQIKPNYDDRTVSLSAEIKPENSPQEKLLIEGIFSDKSSKMSVYDSQHKLLSETNCDEKFCKTKDSNGKLLTGVELGRWTERLKDDKADTQKDGTVINAEYDKVGESHLKNTGELKNILHLYWGNRIFHQEGSFSGPQTNGTKQLNVTYTEGRTSEVSFEGTLTKN